MSIQNFISDPVYKPWMNINCQEIKCRSALVNGTPVVGGEFPNLYLKNKQNAYSIATTGIPVFALQNDNSDGGNSLGELQVVSQGLSKGIRMFSTGIYRLSFSAYCIPSLSGDILFYPLFQNEIGGTNLQINLEDEESGVVNSLTHNVLLTGIFQVDYPSDIYIVVSTPLGPNTINMENFSFEIEKLSELS